jgi:hypothetical protein
LTATIALWAGTFVSVRALASLDPGCGVGRWPALATACGVAAATATLIAVVLVIPSVRWWLARPATSGLDEPALAAATFFAALIALVEAMVWRVATLAH